jgi:hypothetical protein
MRPGDDAGPCVPVRYRDKAPCFTAIKHGPVLTEEESAAEKAKILAT